MTKMEQQLQNIMRDMEAMEQYHVPPEMKEPLIEAEYSDLVQSIEGSVWQPRRNSEIDNVIVQRPKFVNGFMLTVFLIGVLSGWFWRTILGWIL